MVAVVTERDAKIKQRTHLLLLQRLGRNNCMYEQHLQEDTEAVQNGMAL